MANNNLLDIVEYLAPIDNPIFKGTVTAEQFDGKFVGSVAVANTAIKDRNNNVIDKTYATKEELNKATPIGYALQNDILSAVKQVETTGSTFPAAKTAISDQYGNIIDQTYATKQEIATLLAAVKQLQLQINQLKH